MNSETEKKLAWSLFMLRLGVFIVMLMWTLDKFLNPGHAINIFEHFYSLSNFSSLLMYLVAAVEMVLLIGFLLGIKKRFTYGFVLFIHLISTLSAFQQYLNPWKSPNLLFFAAWPMLAACAALYLLREHDIKYIYQKR